MATKNVWIATMVAVGCLLLMGGGGGCSKASSQISHQDFKLSVPTAPNVELYLLKRGTSHQALVCMGGWQANEWLTLERAHLTFDMALNNLEVIDKRQKVPLWDELWIYALAYNTAENPLTIAQDFKKTAKADKLLAKADTRYVLLCHSYGGLIGSVIELGDARVLGSLNAGTPWLGTPIADQAKLDQAMAELYAGVEATWLKSLMDTHIDFTTPSVGWLKPSSAKRRELVASVDFTNRFVYVGECPPIGHNALTRNLSLLALYDAMRWKQSSIQNAQAYGLGSRLVLTCSHESSDGVVPMESASAVGFARDDHVRLVGTRNHSEVIAGSQADEDLHLQMYQDLAGLLWADPRRNAPVFDLWLPEVPIVDIPLTWGKKLSPSTLVFVQDDTLMVAGADGENVQKVPVGELVCSWPKWVDNKTVVFTGKVNGRSDIYLLQDGAELVRMTHTGDNQMATPLAQGFGLVMLSAGQLVFRSFAGLTRVLVEDRLELGSPPVVLGEKVYFSHQTNDGDWQLSRVDLEAHHLSLAQTEPVAQSSYLPQSLGGMMLAVDLSGPEAKLTVVFGKLAPTLDVATQYLNQQNLAQLESVQTNTKQSHIYVGLEGEIRIVSSSSLLKQTAGQWQELLKTQTVTLPDADSLMPVRCSGVQLDAK